MKWKPSHGKSLVCVHWLDADASSPTDAYHDDEIDAVHKTTPVESYGLLLRDNNTGVTLMTEFYEGEKHTFRGRTFIPREMIVKVELLLPIPVSRKMKKVSLDERHPSPDPEVHT